MLYMVIILFLIGDHITRQQLYGRAGRPGATKDKVLIPLWEQPAIEVYSTKGEYLHTLAHQQLQIPSDAWGYAISPIIDGIIYYLLAYNGEHIHSYKVRR